LVLRAARLGLLPRDIEDLGPYELALVLEGRRLQEREQARLVAWHISWMASMHRGSEVTVDQVMGVEQVLGGGNSAGDLFAAEEEAARRRDEQDALASEGWFEADDVELDLEDGPRVLVEDGGE
jgi:hypothetical protein